MILTNKQQEGLRIAVERYRNGEKYTVISGYAGSGKSTLIKFIISALEVPQEEVCYVAFTGKAATVLASKGCPNATTAHKLLYKARPKSDGTYMFIPNPTIDYSIVVVDEISMLPKPMWDLLLKHHCYILATGDPGQLPPVDKDADNHVLDHPHIFLDEIMRQAQDSEIIRLSMWVREGNPVETFPVANQHVQIVKPGDVVSGMYDWADQILCATNAKRNQINTYMRNQKGFGPLPCEGDKVISLHNHWEYFSDKGTWALTNGAIGTLGNYQISNVWLPRYIHEGPVDYMYADVHLEDGERFNMTPIDYKQLVTGEPALNGKQRYMMGKNKMCPEPPFDFSYAYAITTHKAQGSEWEKVLVFEEGFPFDKEEHKRWLYTAITRASKKLVIVRK